MQKKKRQEGKVVWSETGEVTEGINSDGRRVDLDLLTHNTIYKMMYNKIVHFKSI